MRPPKNLLRRTQIRMEAKKLGWLETSPSFKKVGKEGVVVEWSWKISKKKKLCTRSIGYSTGDSAIYTLAKKELLNG